MDKNISEIFKMFQEQISLMRSLLEEKIMQEGARVVTEINMHKRDNHQAYWDPTYYLDHVEKQRKKIDGLDEKMEETNKKITELIEEKGTPRIEQMVRDVL